MNVQIWLCNNRRKDISGRFLKHLSFKGESKKFLKNLILCDYISSEKFLFYHNTCFWRTTWVLFILSQCYFERLHIIKADSVEHWNWWCCSQKTYVLFKFAEKYVRLKWNKYSCSGTPAFKSGSSRLRFS